MNIITKDELVNKVGDIKVLPFVARKVLDTLNDDSCTIDDLSDIIEKDQGIAARVLKISNSALYGLRHEVTGLHQAILILGFKTIKSMVLSVSTRSLYKSFGMKEKILWDHSVGAAIAAKIISAGYGSEVMDAAFIGGLMHDFGKVIMNNETPEVYGEVMMKIYNEDLESITAEEEVYGFNHADIGAQVVERWKFAPMIINILKRHHLNNFKLQDIKDPVAAKSISIVHLADQVCKVLGIGYKDPNETIRLHELMSAQHLKIEKGKMDKLVADIKETYERERSVFE